MSNPDIQYFPSSGTWVKPPRAVAVDVLVQVDGDGEVAVKRFRAPEIPPTIDVEIVKGGRPGGRDGYALIVTHLDDAEKEAQ